MTTQPAGESAPAPKSSRTSSVPPRGASRAIGKRPRMSRFVRVLLGVTLLANVFVGAGVAEAARRLGLTRPWLVGIAFALAGVVLFASRVGAALVDHRRNRYVLTLLDTPNMVHWCASLFTLVVSLFGTAIVPLIDVARGREASWPSTFYLGAYVAGLGFAGYGTLVRRRWFVLRKEEIRVRGLDPRLDGLKIAHLSDLHIGNVTPKEWGLRWASAANAERPALAVVTGDLVTSGTDFHDDIAETVAALEAEHGVFVSMGNHDYFGEGEPLISLLRARGAKVLRNEGHLIERDGAQLYVAAIDDTWTRRDDMRQALAARPDGVPAILLAHDPERFPQAAAHGVALTLSGHTHGGQIAVPFLYRRFSLSHLTHHFHVGLYEKGDASLYVHPGLGTTGPPIRIGIAPAVVILTLRAA